MLALYFPGADTRHSYYLFHFGVQFKKNWYVNEKDKKFKTAGRIYLEENSGDFEARDRSMEQAMEKTSKI